MFRNLNLPGVFWLIHLYKQLYKSCSVVTSKMWFQRYHWVYMTQAAFFCLCPTGWRQRQMELNRGPSLAFLGAAPRRGRHAAPSARSAAVWAAGAASQPVSHHAAHESQQQLHNQCDQGHAASQHEKHTGTRYTCIVVSWELHATLLVHKKINK